MTRIACSASLGRVAIRCCNGQVAGSRYVSFHFSLSPTDTGAIVVIRPIRPANVGRVVCVGVIEMRLLSIVITC